jgi:hypothetical protein
MGSKTFADIMAKKFPNFMTDIKLWVKETLRTQIIPGTDGSYL